MGSIILLDYYKKAFAMNNNFHKIARAAHIRTFSYVIMLFRYLCLFSYTINNWRTHTFCTLGTLLFQNKQPYPEYDIGKILKHTIWVHLQDNVMLPQASDDSTGVTDILHKGKKKCEEFQGKILIYDCSFAVNVGGSE